MPNSTPKKFKYHQFFAFAFGCALAILNLISSTTLGAQRSCQSLFDSPSKQQISVSLANESGLHYITNTDSGFRRIGNKKTFRYINDDGKPVRDQLSLSRIEALNIPPAYKNVWISADPLAHIQARATDENGRPQYTYHKIWTQKVLAETKFRRMLDFGVKLSKFRRDIARDLSKPRPDLDSRIAAVVRLLETAGIRIGGEKYAEENGSYGLTTLEVRHVRIKENSVRFQFIAKEGLPQDIKIEDRAITRIIQFSIAGKKAKDKIFDVSESEVNQYIKDHIGYLFSAKDFRTWVASTQAARVLYELGPQKSRKEQIAVMQAAAEEAASRLNNTWQICRGSYIAPFVLQAYVDNKLDKAFVKVLDPDLAPEENAVLNLGDENFEFPK